MYDFIAIGEMLIDFTPCSVNLFQQNPGGAPANVACVMAKLGRSAAFVGKVGADGFGRACKEALEAAGCDSRYLIRSKAFPTTLAFVTLTPDGNRDFSFYRNALTADVNLTLRDVPETLYGNSKIFHFGSVSMAQEPSRSTVFEAIRRAKDAGASISYDPNLRPPLWGSLEEAKQLILKGIPLCDYLKISDEEKDFLFPDDEEDALGERLCEEYGISLVVITKAKAGCTAFANGLRFDSSAYAVKTIDTTGAGDAFWAGILYKILEKEKPVSRLRNEEIMDILSFSNAIGSLVTTKKGAIAAIPTLEEIERCRTEIPLLSI